MKFQKANPNPVRDVGSQNTRLKMMIDGKGYVSSSNRIGCVYVSGICVMIYAIVSRREELQQNSKYERTPFCLLKFFFFFVKVCRR